MEPPEPASAAPAPSSEPATESAWERGLRHAKEVWRYETPLKYKCQTFVISGIVLMLMSALWIIAGLVSTFSVLWHCQMDARKGVWHVKCCKILKALFKKNHCLIRTVVTCISCFRATVFELVGKQTTIMQCIESVIEDGCYHASAGNIFWQFILPALFCIVSAACGSVAVSKWVSV